MVPTTSAKQHLAKAEVAVVSRWLLLVVLACGPCCSLSLSLLLSFLPLCLSITWRANQIGGERRKKEEEEEAKSLEVAFSASNINIRVCVCGGRVEWGAQQRGRGPKKEP